MNCVIRYLAILLIITTTIVRAQNLPNQDEQNNKYYLFKFKPQILTQIQALQTASSNSENNGIQFLQKLRLGKSNLALVQEYDLDTFKLILQSYGIRFSEKGITTVQNIQTEPQPNKTGNSKNLRNISNTFCNTVCRSGAGPNNGNITHCCRIHNYGRYGYCDSYHIANCHN